MVALGRRLLALLTGLCLALLAPAAEPALASGASSQLTRYPYLTDVVRRNATITWATQRSSSTGSATWGEVGSEGCSAHDVEAIRTSITVGSSQQYQWSAQLTGLRRGATYCYRVFLGSPGSQVDLLGSDDSPAFDTPVRARDDRPFKFAVIGDWGFTTAQGNPYQADVLDELADSGASFALSSGDIAYPSGSQTNYGDLFQTGMDVSGVFGPDFWTVPGSSIPMFPAVGNHGRNSTFLLTWPQQVAVERSEGSYQMETYCCLNGTFSASYPSAWYAFNVGGARFYVLDASWSNTNVGNADLYENDYDYHWTPVRDEYLWLERDLVEHDRQVAFAVFHFPLYSANATEKSDTFLQGPLSLEGLLARNGVDIAFNGHAHIYERNNPSGPDGLISYVTGAGGADLESVNKCSAGSSVPDLVAYAIGWSDTSGSGNSCGSAPRPSSPSQVYHFLLVTVDGNRVTVAPTDSTGRAFDVQSYTFPKSP